jgi:hypothetical protein
MGHEPKRGEGDMAWATTPERGSAKARSPTSLAGIPTSGTDLPTINRERKPRTKGSRR